MMACMNPGSAFHVCTQKKCVGRGRDEIEMQIHTELWDRKEEAHGEVPEACMEEAVSAKLWNYPSSV